MSGNTNCTVYIGNLDERVTDRVLYDILIQAGRVVDLHIPKDKESEKPKGFAFAEYETEEIADYAVKLFSGLVTLYNRTLKFASTKKQISGRDKTPNGSAGVTPTSNSSQRSRPYPVPFNNSESDKLSAHDRFSDYAAPRRRVTDLPSGHGSYNSGHDFEFSRRAFGATLDSISGSRSRR
ncbi:protein HSH49 isoform X1 [Arachis duranensis]|uniref:Protein HSH49 isoform X1 n=1 Tax=Arachis duranensis TaxID=130453 RepID=A0A6P5MPQ4_ARADU|nr:protein HSH49 isoform X1 [Arachis duranensis]XP_057732719.1 protein HSH49 isoform X1 [Arachis stenosperma]